MNNEQEAILKVLAYFDVFHYPVTNKEIQAFLSVSTDQAKTDETIKSLIDCKLIFKLGEFYSLQNNMALALRRHTGNQLALKQMKIAGKASKILSRFPYVKGLLISGSLSKNFADEKTDIDFFIITTANRLWIARTIMFMFVKLTYLVKRQNWFCMNYYIDEAMLEIPEKNIFTAMEIVTLIPMNGKECSDDFFTANSWTKKYFPNKNCYTQNTVSIKKGFVRSCIEKLFNNKAGDSIDTWLMRITDKRWQKKSIQGKVNEKGIRMGMKAGKHFSKPNPENFQDKVIQQYEHKINEALLIQKITSETTFISIPVFEMK